MFVSRSVAWSVAPWSVAQSRSRSFPRSLPSISDPRVRLPLVCVSAMTAATLGFGVASAKAAPTLVDDPMPIPAPISAPALPGAAALPGVPGVPGAAVGNSSAGVNAANSFLQVLNGMLNKVVPGVGSIMPSDVSSLTPPAAGVPGAPALETPPVGTPPAAAAPAPGFVPQTLAGSRTFSGSKN